MRAAFKNVGSSAVNLLVSFLTWIDIQPMGHDLSTPCFNSKCEFESESHETIKSFRRRNWAPKARGMLSDEEIPILLRRSYVKHGYRPLNRPLCYYFGSAFSWHNELINFWTHLIPLIGLYVFYILPELASERPRAIVLFAHIGVSCLFLCSAVTHLMHSRSPIDHIFWLLIDFSGIAMFSLSVGSNSLLMSFFYVPTLAAIILLQYLSTCGFFVLRPFWKTRHLIRIMSCGAVAFWIYIPLYDRYLVGGLVQAFALGNGSSIYQAIENDISLVIHNRGFQWLLLAAFFMGVNFPESCAPGRFDLIGYGHQLFHLCITCVTWCVCETAHVDCAIRTSGPPGLWNDPMIKPLLYVLCTALLTAFVSVTVFLNEARKKKLH
ncbi:hypothetical protein M3Y94_00158900 [Aphelenchoides besseyi]|nr:hypothetical protein M3Y94_00158900 [Aphelenchoides besseyi]